MKKATRGARRRLLLSLVAAPLLVASLGAAAVKTPWLLSDIRPSSMGSVDEGRDTLRAIQRAHGGAGNWRSLSWVELEFTGTVPFLPARLTFGVPEQFDLVVRFTPAVPGRASLILNGTVHEVDARDGNEGLALVANSVRHLWELPFAMQSADVVRHVADTQGYERVFASWGTPEPQADTDQYILWSRGGVIERFYSTARVITPFTVACVDLEAFRTVEGFVVPGKVTVRGDHPQGRVVQRWELRGIRFGPRGVDG